MSLKLKYFQKFKNVGDAFSEKVAHHYISHNIDVFENEELNSDNLIVIGSILEWADSYSSICGAGLIQSSSILRHKPKNIYCVRGPLTAFFLERQGIQAGNIYGDPGLLLCKVYPSSNLKSTYKIGLVPHYVDKDSDWIDFCRAQGVLIIDVLSPLDVFTKQLQQCDVILSSSLHGIVFAHSYGKPALWVEISGKVIGDGFKFYDYYLSAGVSPEKVLRYKVSVDSSPFDLQSLAQTYDLGSVISNIEEALYLAKKQMINEN